MLVNVKTRQSTRIDLELILVRQFSGRDRIQAVDAFNDQNVVFIHAQLLSFVNAFALLEIEGRKINLLSCKKRRHILVKQFGIHRFNAVKIIIAVNIDRCLLPVDKPVVHADDMRPQPERTQLNREPVGKCCFAGRRRPRHKDKLHIRAVVDFLRDIADSALLQRFLHENHIADIAFTDCFIQVADRGNINEVPPLRRKHQLFVKIRLLFKRRQFVRALFPWKIQKNPALVRKDLEQIDIAGRRQHVSVIIIIKAVQRIDVDCGASAEVEQLLLVAHAFLVKQRHRIVNRISLFADRQILFRHFPHLLIQRTKQRIVYLDVAQKSAVIGLAERKLDFDIHARRVLDRLDEHHDRCPRISRVSCRRSRRDEGQNSVLIDPLRKLAHLAVKKAEGNRRGILIPVHLRDCLE